MTAGGEKVRTWLEQRLQLEALLKLAKEKEVPQHRHQLWYYFGGIALFLFVVQVITGILLLVYYSPSEASAHASVLDITSKVDFGWLVRSVHVWGAHLMVAAALIHMFSVFFMRAYRALRELTWLTGFIMLTLLLGFGFSGYLLPWDELAYFATQVGLGITESVPLVGKFLADLLRAGPQVTGFTIQRFFALHVVVLPLVFTGVLFFPSLPDSTPRQCCAAELPPAASRCPACDPFLPELFLQRLTGVADLPKCSHLPGGDLPAGGRSAGRHASPGTCWHPAGMVLYAALCTAEIAASATRCGTGATVRDCAVQPGRLAIAAGAFLG